MVCQIPNNNRKQPTELFLKKGFLKKLAKSTEKHLCWSLFFNKVVGLQGYIIIKKEIQTQMFSCEFCVILKNTFFIEHLLTTDSKYSKTKRK